MSQCLFCTEELDGCRCSPDEMTSVFQREGGPLHLAHLEGKGAVVVSPRSAQLQQHKPRTIAIELGDSTSMTEIRSAAKFAVKWRDALIRLEGLWLDERASLLDALHSKWKAGVGPAELAAMINHQLDEDVSSWLRKQPQPESSEGKEVPFDPEPGQIFLGYRQLRLGLGVDELARVRSILMTLLNDTSAVEQLLEDATSSTDKGSSYFQKNLTISREIVKDRLRKWEKDNDYKRLTDHIKATK